VARYPERPGGPKEHLAAVSETILVVDNEPDILRFVEVNLRLEGFEVVLASDGHEGLERAFNVRPSLILLDVMMPGVDGYEVCRRLRADARTSHIPVIFLTAKSMTADKVVGLTAGADDYVLKPFDPIELVARVRTTLQRAAELRAASPVTGLPGNHRIGLELSRRLAEGGEFAVAYADVNDFKSYNDRYGFLRGDGVILLTADVLHSALVAHGGEGWFLGHVGGDDFVFACAPAQVVAVCEAVISEFDRRIPDAYDGADVARGYLELPDRRGQLQRYPLATISVGVATTERRSFGDHRELIEVATEMKQFLKAQRTGSSYAIDNRADDEVAARTRTDEASR
jgi:CheY-like chemotaxis protein